MRNVADRLQWESRAFRSCRAVWQYASHIRRGRDNVNLRSPSAARSSDDITDAWLARHSVLVAGRSVKFDQIDQQQIIGRFRDPCDVGKGGRLFRVAGPVENLAAGLQTWTPSLINSSRSSRSHASLQSPCASRTEFASRVNVALSSTSKDSRIDRHRFCLYHGALSYAFDLLRYGAR